MHFEFSVVMLYAVLKFKKYDNVTPKKKEYKYWNEQNELKKRKRKGDASNFERRFNLSRLIIYVLQISDLER